MSSTPTFYKIRRSDKKYNRRIKEQMYKEMKDKNKFGSNKYIELYEAYKSVVNYSGRYKQNMSN